LLVLMAFDSVTVAQSGVTADESPTRIEKLPGSPCQRLAATSENDDREPCYSHLQFPLLSWPAYQREDDPLEMKLAY
jgi:hypothetical protein